MKVNTILIIGILLLFSCSGSKEVSLDAFDLEEDVFVSGKGLMALQYGLHPLEDQSENQRILMIGVHGSASRGYEWVYPLKTLDTHETLTLFFRWNDNNCPGPSYEKLKSSIDSMLQSNPNLKEVVIAGHSYGALLVSMFSSDWTNEISLTLHTIAGPLAGISSVKSFCSYSEPTLINDNVSFYEWRTIKEIDGAFKSLDFDPQVINLPGSNVKRLPETYNGRKLGHNWSVSWVADEINKGIPN
ncbi:MAG: triacylglycerol lipase [Gammaproteobacteria bacterium]|nr:triacylglycerol lipase [Gammaproteobacteria bacterium]|tara:strand:+ start:928 stop:1659 length:732 start_codon:yes stop_codon:yes gene_type:complete